MKTLFIIGDMHIETQKQWCEEFFDKFYKWFNDINFDQYNKNFNNRELLCLGDITDKNTNDGRTIEKVTKLFRLFSQKFSKIYVIQGNHDAGLKQLGYFSSIQFLPELYPHNIQVITSEEIFDTYNGFKIEALPHQQTEGQLIEDFYNDNLEAEFYNTPVDLLCGHVQIKEENKMWGGIKIEKFKNQKHYAFGHIHIRSGNYPTYYTGSIGAFKYGEDQTTLPRIIKVLNKEDNKVVSSGEIVIPEFIKYHLKVFGTELSYKKNSDSQIHIYRISEARNLKAVSDYYKDYYIGSIESVVYNKTISSDTIFNVKSKSNFEYFKMMLSETKYPIKREQYKILKGLLS